MRQQQTDAERERDRVRREHDESLIVQAIRELGTPRFQAILDKLGWTYKDDMRRLDTGLQRLKKRGALVLAHMRWSLP